MPQFLFVVDMPRPGLNSRDPSAASRGVDFCNSAESIELPKGAMKMLCDNVWLFPVETSDQPLRALAKAARPMSIS
jgi:hypothetical protein